MFKKTKLVVMLLALTMVAALFAGCTWINENVRSISVVSQPKTEYRVGEEFDKNFTIEVVYTDGKSETVSYDNDFVTFTNDFSSSTVGTYTCTVSVKGQSSVSFSFAYSVVADDGKFASGTGSKADPYVVTTAEQFKHIAEEDGKFYKLGNDIDLSTVEAEATDYDGWKGYVVNKTNAFELDGQGYKVALDGARHYLFGHSYNATIKNLNVEYGANSRSCSIVAFPYGTLVFENVTTSGTMVALGNTAPFAEYAWCATSIKFTNCTNNVNLTGTAVRCAVFIGRLDSNAGTESIEFVNCVNNGNIEASAAFVFIANTNASKAEEVSIKISNCKNNGKIVAGIVGLVNTLDESQKGLKVTQESNEYNYNKNSKKVNITSFDFTYKDGSLKALAPVLESNNKDVTLVNNNGKVEFNSNVATKLEETVGANYTVLAYVRCYISDKADMGHYLFSENFTSLDLSVPYVKNATLIDGTGSGTKTLICEQEAIKAYKNWDDGTELVGSSSTYYCYFIYDANGAMIYCGDIAYADIQNA